MPGVETQPNHSGQICHTEANTFKRRDVSCSFFRAVNPVPDCCHLRTKHWGVHVFEAQLRFSLMIWALPVFQSQLIGLRKNLQENPLDFMGKSGWFPVSRFSLKSTYWQSHLLVSPSRFFWGKHKKKQWHSRSPGLGSVEVPPTWMLLLGMVC